MPTSGAYTFQRSKAADPQGFVADALELAPGEWAWYQNGDFLAVYAGCPDCKQPMTLWRRYQRDVKGHTLDAQGNVHPSILHSFVVNGRETCGFHTMPTRLADFVDHRTEGTRP